ncbi:unnamed protein product [Meganyctiphanes norvegica]|uniref:C-type lectin domain-containing protein n=1 Tax=Meganyctiphanes norvegica TaxID=48144 RepID=A0AAV2RW89_MEGNR
MDDHLLLTNVSTKLVPYWVGGTTNFGIEWYWEDGRPISTVAPYWDYSEPSDISNKCLALDIHDSAFYSRAYLFSHDCGKSAKFICQVGSIDCPNAFEQIGSYCYFKSWENSVPKLGWQSSRDFCTTLDVFEGFQSDLAVMGMQNQDDYLLIKSIFENEDPLDRVWLGAMHEDQNTIDNFEWIDGRDLPVESYYWGYDEPKKMSEFNSVYLYHQKLPMNSFVRIGLGVGSEGSNDFLCQLFLLPAATSTTTTNPTTITTKATFKMTKPPTTTTNPTTITTKSTTKKTTTKPTTKTTKYTTTTTKATTKTTKSSTTNTKPPTTPAEHLNTTTYPYPTTIKHSTTPSYTIECLPHFEIIGESCYLFSSLELDHVSASKYCRSLGVGHIYTISLAMLDLNNINDQSLLTEIASRKAPYRVGGEISFGFEWIWEDGRIINPVAPYWDFDEPNDIGNKCLMADVHNSSYYHRAYLYDSSCDTPMKFICQEGNIQCPSGFLQIGSYCYFKSWTNGVPNLGWEEARDFCRSLDVHEDFTVDLAIMDLDDQDDYQLIANIVSQEDADGFIWIGATEEDELIEDNFKWIDGRDLSEYSYYWKFDQPQKRSTKSNVYLSHHKLTINNITRINLAEDADGNYAFLCQAFKVL